MSSPVTPLKLSKKAYDSPAKAAIAGFWVVRGIGNNDWEEKEFVFFVIYVGNGDYHYSEPFTDGSRHGIKITTPVGHVVSGVCHTHPKSIGTGVGDLSTGNFSPDDLKAFTDLNVRFPKIFYLMTRHGLRFAAAPSDFPAGKVLDWLPETP
jgi:hypothetical protein